MFEVIVVKEAYISNFQNKIEELLGKGFVIQGNLQVVCDVHGNVSSFIQMMVREI